MAKYTYQAGATWPNSLISLTNYKDADNTVGSLIAQIKAYQEAGDFSSAQDLIDENIETLKPYALDAAMINKYVEELRNVEIYAKSYKQQIFYDDDEETSSIYMNTGDVWIGKLNDEGGETASMGNATPNDVLEGVIFSAEGMTGATGTMTNNGSVSVTVTPGQVYTIPQGYHDGSGTVTGTESGGSSVPVILNLGTFYANGVKSGIDVRGASEVYFNVQVPTVMTVKDVVVPKGTTTITLPRVPEQFVEITGYAKDGSSTSHYCMWFKKINSGEAWIKTQDDGAYKITKVEGAVITLTWNAASKIDVYAF